MAAYEGQCCCAESYDTRQEAHAATNGCDRKIHESSKEAPMLDMLWGCSWSWCHLRRGRRCIGLCCSIAAGRCLLCACSHIREGSTTGGVSPCDILPALDHLHMRTELSYLPSLLALFHLHDLTVMDLNVCVCQ